MRAIAAGLDGIAFTEHYSYDASSYVDGLREKYCRSIRIFRGVEFSSAEGHCLVFGVNTDRLSLKYAPVAELVEVVSRHGGVVIPSHPYRGANSLGELVWTLKGICALEGYNGYSHHAFNELSVSAARALGLPYTGGSDAHTADDVGSCFTAFNDCVTYENFIDLLRAGHYRGVDLRKVSRGIAAAQPFD